MSGEELETIIWIVTGKCNLACKHCYATPYRGEDELPTNTVVAVLREAADAGVGHVHFTGGEPLLRKDMLVILREAADLGLEASIFTNATLLNEGVARELSALGVKVFTSLDGPSKDIHELTRGEGSWDALMRGVKVLREAGVPFHVNVSVSELDWRYVGEAIEKAIELGAESVSIIPAMPAGTALRIHSYVSSRHYVAALRAVERVEEELGVVVDVWCTPFLRVVSKSPWLRTANCRDWGVMDVTPSGRVVLCDVMNVTAAHVVEDGVRGAWAKLMSHPVIKSVSRPPSVEPCASCPIASECRGGCFARSHILRRNPHSPDPLCPRSAE